MKQTKTICDRCGKEIFNFIIPFVEFNQTLLFGNVHYKVLDRSFELCSECSKEFGRFIKGGKCDE